MNWVLDADIQGFYDAMAHSWIIRFLEHRIADRRILRLIAKWLKVGTTEDGRVTRCSCGAPQGAVISPILANVYLHYAYDLWVHRWRRTKATGDVVVVRYADDTIVGFQHEHEAQAFLHDLQERLREFGLTLHPAKTRLIRFGPPPPTRPKSGSGAERASPKRSASLASRTSARDHANGARSSSGARRSRRGCRPHSRRSRWSCAEECTTPSREPERGCGSCCKGT